jgi:hypothetical protein
VDTGAAAATVGEDTWWSDLDGIISRRDAAMGNETTPPARRMREGALPLRLAASERGRWIARKSCAVGAAAIVFGKADEDWLKARRVLLSCTHTSFAINHYYRSGCIWL